MSERSPAYGEASICPKCGDRYQVIVECLVSSRSQTCNVSHLLRHAHYACTKCGHEWAENRSAGLAS